MASVSITFDNTEAWLPIDFSEVSITRRAYRDGQNEYLINQQKVRLKDVSELLSHSSLAERTYTIIGQGLVDTALTLKSDERRRLFEEAAGIGLYRTRKDQSLRRLEATLHNLERVEDLLTELRPRVRSLERQAARAEEHSRLRADLRATLRQWYGYHWNRAQAELLDLRQEADDREVNLGVARQKQLELSRELNELRSRTQELRVQLNEWNRRLAELHASREGATKSLAVADERQRALMERSQALKEEKQRIEKELENLTARLQESQQDAGRYQTEVEEARLQLQEAQRVLAERQATQDETAQQLQNARDQVSLLERQQGNLAAQREQLEAKLARGQSEAAELEHNLLNLNSDLAALKEQSSQAEEQANRAEKSSQDYQKRQSELVAQTEEELKNLDDLKEKASDLEALQALIQAQLRGLEDAEKSAAGFALGAQLLLKAAEEKRLGVKRGTLGRELKVSAELEPAIAAALGSYVDAIVLAESKDTETALSLLEGREASGALIDTRHSGAKGRLQGPKGNGLLGVAADLVEAPDELQHAVDLLLGSVLVSKDRKSAKKLLEENPGATQVVTLLGELFHRSGQIEVRSAKSSAGLARPGRNANCFPD